MSGSTWVPTWAAYLWTAGYVMVIAVHVRHMMVMSGRSRWWHATHVLMALGMAQMFWPGGSTLVSAPVAQVGYVGAALIVGGALLRDVNRDARVGLLWPIAILDLLSMAYMYAVPSHGVRALTIVLAGWFAVEAMAWSLGALPAAAQRSGLRWSTDPSPPGAAPSEVPPVLATSGGSTRAGGPVVIRAPSPMSPPVSANNESLHVDGVVVRATLTVMSVGMAYMLLAMQFGMGGTAGMTGMTHMPGM